MVRFFGGGGSRQPRNPPRPPSGRHTPPRPPHARLGNPDEYEIVKAWNALCEREGWPPLRKFDHSACPPDCPYKEPNA